VIALETERLLLREHQASDLDAFCAMEMDPDDALPVAVAAYCQARLFADAATASPAATRSLAHHLVRRAGALDAGDPLVTTARAAVGTCARAHVGTLTLTGLTPPSSPD